MKKRVFKKLSLNKVKIAVLNNLEMNNSIGGARPSQIGLSCVTGECCYSNIECETDTQWAFRATNPVDGEDE